MAKIVRICVCHPNEQHCQAIIKAFQAQNPELVLVAVTDLRRASETIKEEKADVVVVGVDAPGDPALRTVSAIKGQEGVSAGVIVVSQQPSQELLVACMRTGCDEFLQFPIDAKELGDALKRLFRKRGIAEQVQGKVTAIYSAKGGVGNTTIATNLAALTARALGGENPSCVLDLNLHFGNVALMLDIREFSRSLQDACQDAERLDAALLSGYMTRHESGAAVLPAPIKIADATEVDPAKLMSVIQQCRDLFAHVFLDLPHNLDTMTVTGLDAADQVFLLCDMMLPTIHNTKQVVEMFKELEFKKTKLKFIVNRYYDSDEISLQEVSEHVQLPVYWLIPYDSAVAMASANSGKTFDAVDDDSQASRSLIALAQELTGVAVEKPKKKRFSFFGG